MERKSDLLADAHPFLNGIKGDFDSVKAKGYLTINCFHFISVLFSSD